MSAAEPGRRVVVFARAPRLGAVKTRLAARIGDAAALAFHRSTLFAVTARLAADPGWRVLLAVTPDAAADEAGLWPPDVPRRPQGDGDLGARMGRFLADAALVRPVVVVGSDIPAITAAHVARAFEALAAHDLAFGPAEDGGYWLIGAAAPPPPGLFDGVRWSTRHALADTRRRAGTARAALVDRLEDVDDEAAYRRWLGR